MAPTAKTGMGNLAGWVCKLSPIAIYSRGSRMRSVENCSILSAAHVYRDGRIELEFRGQQTS